MNLNINKTDASLYRITRVMWFCLSLAAVYILYTVYNMKVDPESALGVYHTVPEMLEHILAGCIVVLALGTAFEYLSKRDL